MGNGSTLRRGSGGRNGGKRWRRAVRSCAPGFITVLLVFVFLVLAAEAVVPAPDVRVRSSASGVFTTLTMIAFLVGGYLLLARARIGDEALWVPLGFGAFAYGFSVVGLGEMLAFAFSPSWLAAARAVFLAVVILVFSDAIHSGVATGRARHACAAFGGAASIVALVGGLFGVRNAGALALAALAVMFWIAGRVARSAPLIWFGVVLIGLVLAELALGATAGQETLWSITASVVRITGLLSALAALASEVFIAYWGRVGEVKQFSGLVEMLELKAMEAAKSSAERRHEATSALAAMELGLHAIASYEGSLDRDAVQSALSTELSMLRRIVAAEAQDEAIEEFTVWRVVQDVVAAQRLAGVRIALHVPDDLIAVGRPTATAEALQAVLDNARTHASGSRVVVSAARVDDHIEIVVADSGDGVPSDLSVTVFDRDVSSGGGGLGLFIARKLMEDQGGAISLDLTVHSGAAFVVALPAAQPLRQVHQVPRSIHPYEFISLVDPHHSHQWSLARPNEPNERAATDG